MAIVLVVTGCVPTAGKPVAPTFRTNDGPSEPISLSFPADSPKPVLDESSSVSLEPLVVLGEPVPEREDAWKDHIDFLVWSSDDRIIYGGKTGRINCYEFASNSTAWSETLPTEIRQLDASDSRVAVLDDKHAIHVFDAVNGNTITVLDQNAFSRKVGEQHALPNQLAFQKNGSGIVVATYGQASGSVYLLDALSFEIKSRFLSDGFLTEITSTDDRHVVTLSNTNNIRIHSISSEQEIFSLKHFSQSAIDAPFISHALFDGKETLIYSIDNSWATGVVIFYDIQAKQMIKSFDSLNGHLEIDVDFQHSRMALTGTSEDLMLVDFEGHGLAERKSAAQQRIAAVKFSPNGQRLAIASWDTTVRVFEIKQLDEP